MAAQGFFSRVPSLINNCSFLFSTRLPQFSQISGFKRRAVDKLKELNVPEKPKRPLTPFFKFAQDHRQKIIKKYPDWKVTQIAAQCAVDWRALDPTTKSKYEAGFKNEMEQYAERYLEYANNLTSEQKQALEEYKKETKSSKVRRERRKQKRENDKPKRPVGPYILFVMEQAKAQPNISYMKLVKDLKETWDNMPAGEQLKYISATNKAKEQYEKDLIEWEKRMMDEGKVDIVRQSTLTGKPPKSKSPKDKH